MTAMVGCVFNMSCQAMHSAATFTDVLFKIIVTCLSF